MTGNNRRVGLLVTLAAALTSALMLIAGCGTQALVDRDPKAAYMKACEDARTVEPSEVYKYLKAVVSWEKGLEWQKASGADRVKVVTWTGKDYYDKSVAQEYKLPVDANLWVTLAPEIKEFAENSGGATELRVEQLLGLPPDSGKTKFVEMWVNPSDLFRPSPDPEIVDHEADLDFPTIPGKFLSYSASTVTEWDTTTNADRAYTYEQWFNQRKDNIYSGSNPYPWTRLGYTFDWGDPDSEIGLSEFVVLGGSTVGVASVTPTADYLKVE